VITANRDNESSLSKYSILRSPPKYRISRMTDETGDDEPCPSIIYDHIDVLHARCSTLEKIVGKQDDSISRIISLLEDRFK